MAWSYRITEEGVTIRAEQVCIAAVIYLDGKHWAGRELTLPVTQMQGRTPAQRKALIDAQVANLIKLEGKAETAIKTAVVEACPGEVTIPPEMVA